ncbi:transcription termination/antitermination NusG family protein [Aquabacter sp. CN5-332]|uniref:transcription termination/antitermination protein NusG n=1 Tax=Aquabacter sp. CN5-332 TaxID=3156608 RepID=UPI0032B52A1F
MASHQRQIELAVKAAQESRRAKRRRVVRFPTEQPTAETLMQMVKGLQWYALRVATQKEFAAQEILLRKGVTTYCPSDRRWRKVSRYVREKELKDFPLVPGYVFAGFPLHRAAWFEVFSVPIILGCIGVDGVPKRIKADAMERMIGCYRNGFTRPAEEKFMVSNHEFKVGQIVRVAKGPFEGHEVPVVELKGKHARVLLELFGIEHQIKIEAEILEPAA